MFLCMMAASILCGAIWAFITGIFKARFGTKRNDIYIDVNYIAIKFVTYLQSDHGKIRIREGSQRSRPSARMPRLPDFLEHTADG